MLAVNNGVLKRVLCCNAESVCFSVCVMEMRWKAILTTLLTQDRWTVAVAAAGDRLWVDRMWRCDSCNQRQSPQHRYHSLYLYEGEPCMNSGVNAHNRSAYGLTPLYIVQTRTAWKKILWQQITHGKFKLHSRLSLLVSSLCTTVYCIIRCHWRIRLAGVAK